MDIFIYTILATTFVSLASFSGALTLFLKEKLLDKLLLVLVAFSAGVLIGAAFFNLLPEIIQKAGSEGQTLMALFFLTLGFSSFFFLEQILGWHHHHTREHPEVMPFSYFILTSDALHNFIDGMVIATSFSIDFTLGLITTFVIALHEIPQEIGDFAVLIYGGVQKGKALLLNFASAIVAVLGGVTGFLFSESMAGFNSFLLPFAAGNFIYISASDLIPEIKQNTNLKKALYHFTAFTSGLILMFSLKLLTGGG